ncbi:ribonuclease H-like protein [Aulographum hederae CBS 113979]|uniref:Ribonuclease n=1 Tax=Aulographum hederae CBS 113979 TaxID=1176131 RepID=A0A6G1HBR9_9PEZI|nr:ribonuclease H-like protein [Aulographum hederae CBS 113979]
MDDTAMDSQEFAPEPQDLEQETPNEDIFKAPSIHPERILSGNSYTHYSGIPELVRKDMGTECVLGVDEAGRGPVLGPMVYGIFYLPIPLHHSLLAETHHFDDSKVLTPAVRSALMQTLCTPDSPSTTPSTTGSTLPSLYASSGWATTLLSARSISSHMLPPATSGPYNLNAQAMDATIELITGVLSRGVNVKEIYVDTIGRPETYQKKLEKIFPMCRVTVAKKADSLYPCVSAASVCAKVTRDAALEVLWEAYADEEAKGQNQSEDSPKQKGDKGTKAAEPTWGSGYPSDARCTAWMKRSMDPVFGWGAETRFSWGTAKEMLEGKKGTSLAVEWPADEDPDSMKMTDFFVSGEEEKEEGGELVSWYGRRVDEMVF